VPNAPINVIILVDKEDPIDLWREEGQKIAEKFVERYGSSIESYDITKYEDFNLTIKEMCANHPYCD